MAGACAKPNQSIIYMQHKTITALALSLLLVSACSSGNGSGEATTSGEGETTPAKEATMLSEEVDQGPFARITLPDGFSISYFAKEVPGARSMVRSPSGVIYVGNRDGDKVLAVRDTDGDYTADEVIVLAEGLNMPNGVAFKDGDLYVAEVSRILRFPDIEKDLNNPPAYEVVKDDLPRDRHHGWKYIAFGPDGKLYVPVGAPCNICESKPVYAAIHRMNPDGSGMEVVARGVRNTVGFDWHPETGELWFTDNGRDHLGDNYPPCELNRLKNTGDHFGYPYCHAGDISDPEFGEKQPCSDFVAPAMRLGPHVAPLGMLFYTGEMFPEAYRNKILIAEHGSWNRSKKIGYRITTVDYNSNSVASNYKPFIDGWLNDATQDVSGRPVDVIQLPDGSILISDDMAECIYRVTYSGE